MNGFDYPAPLDEYDLHGAEGGFFSAVGGALKGAVGGFIGSGGNPLAAIGGGISGAIGGDEYDEPAVQTTMPAFGPSSPCNSPMVRDQNGLCVFPSSPGDISVGGVVGGGGQLVHGRYGIAMAPQAIPNVRRRCPDGMVLGKDSLCYNKRDLRKSERKWNPGRKPLFTGGDLNAISRASKLEDRAKKIAQDLGFNVRTNAAAARDSARRKRVGRGGRAKQLGPGITVVDTD